MNNKIEGIYLGFHNVQKYHSILAEYHYQQSSGHNKNKDITLFTELPALQVISVNIDIKIILEAITEPTLKHDNCRFKTYLFQFT